MKEVKVEYVNLDDDMTIEELQKEYDELIDNIIHGRYEADERKKLAKRFKTVTKVLEEKKEIKSFGRVLSDEEREKHYEELSEQANKIGEEYARMDELIEQQEQREAEMQKVYDDFIKTEKEMDEIDDQIFPKKQITVKLFPNAHKKLKVMATSRDTTLNKVATSIVEDKIFSIDIVKYVSDEFENAQKMFVPEIISY